jgi:competence protein ComEC
VAARLALPGALIGLALGILGADARAGSVALVAAAAAGAFGAGLALARRVGVGVGCAALAVGMLLGTWRGAALALPSGPGSVADLIGRGDTELAGEVVDDPRPRGSTQQVVLETLIARLDGRAEAVRGRLMATLPRALPLAVGRRVVLRAEVEAPEAFDGFDYPAYLARQGIGGLVRAREARILDGPARGGPAEVAAAVRNWLLGGLNEIVPEPESALGAGILLGVRSSIAPEVSDAFAVAGLTHVVAISGWNIAIVAAIVGALLRPLEQRRGGHWLAPSAAAATIAAYVVLTGASPSVVRAALMAGAMMVARFGGSRAHAASALGLACTVMLVAAPAVLWDVGFQLSALATAGLILFGGTIEERLAGWPAWLREPIALTLAAQLTTLPVVVGSFGRLSLVAPLANVVVVPLVPLVMLLCAIAAPLGAVASTLQLAPLTDLVRWGVGGGAWLLLRAMILAGQAAASIPFAAVPVAAPGWLALAWYPALGMAWRRATRQAGHEVSTAEEVMPLTVVRARAPVLSAAIALLRGTLRTLARPTVGLAAAGALLVALTLVSLPDGRLHLVALDVGQGDAILVTAPSGATMLVDGGPDPDLLLRRLGEHLPWWRRRIDVMILTHPHEDHVAGLVAALERYRVGLILDGGRDYENPTYPRFLRTAHAEPGGRFAAARASESMRLDATTSFTLLYPTAADVAGPLPDGDINNASVVGLLRFAGFTALLTGDAEMPVERLLAERGLLTRIDVLKVGHHGSHSSSGPALLDATRPGAALISAGMGNDYGHPHRVTLDHLHAIRGLRLHRTDLEGSLEVISDGLRYRVTSRAGSDPWRPVVGRAITADRAARSIGAWPYPPSPRLSCCLPPLTFPTGSSRTRVASVASRPRRRGSWPRPASSSIRTSSRSPPCCTTWTSSRRATMARSTGSWVPAGWRSADSPSWSSRSRRTRSAACWIRHGPREAGPRWRWRSPTGMSRRASCRSTSGSTTSLAAIPPFGPTWRLPGARRMRSRPTWWRRRGSPVPSSTPGWRPRGRRRARERGAAPRSWRRPRPWRSARTPAAALVRGRRPGPGQTPIPSALMITPVGAAPGAAVERN